MPIVNSFSNGSARGLGFTSATRPKLPDLWVYGGRVNSAGMIATSDDDGDTWTAQTTPFGSNNVLGVASNGSDLWVAVGAKGTLATSPDAVTWTARTSTFGTSDIRNVIWANGLWVACGDSGKVATSTNGTTWTQQTSGTTDAMRGMDYGAGTYAIGGLSLFKTSTDGATWTTRTVNTAILYKGIHYFAAQSIWVIGADSGTTNALASSPDAITWTQRNSTSNNQGVWSPFASSDTILVNNNGTGSLGLDFVTQTSTNGTTYTNRGSTFISDVACSDTGLFIGARLSGGQIRKSTDGINWTDVNHGLGNVNGYCIAHSSMKPGSR